jgi:hypothetical protein
MEPAKNPVIGWACTIIGLVVYIVHMFMKYVAHRPIEYLLWVAVIFILLGFVLRRFAKV